MVLEAKSSRSKCQQGWFLLESMRKNLFHTSPLASGGLLEIIGVPWLIEASYWSLSSSILPVYVSFSKFPFLLFFFLIKTPVTWIRAQPNNLTLIDYLCKDSGFPGGIVVKNLPANAGDARDVGLIPVKKPPWSRKSQLTLVSWESPWEFHGQKSLAGYSPWGHRVTESDMTVCAHSREGHTSKSGHTQRH